MSHNKNNRTQNSQDNKTLNTHSERKSNTETMNTLGVTSVDTNTKNDKATQQITTTNTLVAPANPTASTNSWKQAYREVKPSKWLVFLCIFSFVLAVCYPTQLETYPKSYPQAYESEVYAVVNVTEDTGRYLNTALQVALPVVLADKIGMVQLLYVALATTLGTHAFKRGLNHVELAGLRLGQRPHDVNSKYNMPSGHSSMASSAAFFVCRRYGWRYAIIVVPIMFLTMYTRVMLNVHTISAVIAGAIIGILMAMLFTSKYHRPPKRRALTQKSANT